MKKHTEGKREATMLLVGGDARLRMHTLLRCRIFI
jgi:hypothetical protein